MVVPDDKSIVLIEESKVYITNEPDVVADVGLLMPAVIWNSISVDALIAPEKQLVINIILVDEVYERVAVLNVLVTAVNAKSAEVTVISDGTYI